MKSLPSINNMILQQRIWIKGVLVALMFLLTYSKALSLLVNTWLSRGDYSHGFLVPLISLYFIWTGKDSFNQLPVRPNIPAGLFLTLIGCLTLLMGYMGSAAIVQQFSILVTIPGLVLLLLGTKFLKRLSLPLAYLIFMVPVTDVIIDKIHWPFQLCAATLSVALLKFLNIPVFQNFQYIELPGITLEVAEECSGVRFLISIIALAIPLAYFTQRRFWSRLILILLAVIIGVLTNVLRVTFIGIWSYNGGTVVHGPLHIFQGLFVSVVGFTFLFIAAIILSKITSHKGGKPLTGEGIPIKKPEVYVEMFGHAWFAAMVVLLITGVLLYMYNPRPVPLKKNINEFPTKIGDWSGGNHNEPFRVYGADSEITRVYRDSSGNKVILYIGYFESQSQGRELIHYRLQDLYKKTEEVEIPTFSHGTIRVNKTVYEKDKQKILALYLYDLSGRVVTNRYKAKFITAFNGLIHGRTNGAIIIVYSDLSSPDEHNRIFNNEVSFVQTILPALRDYLP